MLINYFKIAWRNLIKSKTFSFINIFGLAAGLTCCMLISIYLLHEFSYDSYQPDGKDVYEMATTFSMNHKDFTMAAVPTPMAATVKKEFPEVRQTTHLLQLSMMEGKTMLQYRVPGGIPISFFESKGFMTDSSFFRMFSYHFIEGAPASALDQPNTIVISEEIAHKLFGNSPALGKMIHVSSGMNGDHDFAVRGVFRPGNKPSHIDGQFFMSLDGGDVEQFMRRQANDFATNNMFVAYLRLAPGTRPAALEAKFPAFLDKYAGKQMKEMGFEKHQFLIPLKDIHLRSDILNPVTPTASRTYLYILGSIAIFTLLIACINFMNLATARSAKRSAEVGIRKVLGAVKGLLIGQFLGESILMSGIAFFLAWGFTVALLPAFSHVTNRELALSLPEQLPLLVGFLGLAIATGLLAGIYPAFYLSSFQPAKVLKGKFSNSLAAISLRKGLVVFQFIISVTLIVASVVINDQMAYLRNKDLGFDKTSQIVVPLRSSTAKGLCPALENEFRNNTQVISAGAAAFYPGIANPSDNLIYADGQFAQDAKRARMNFVDYEYMKTLGLQPVAGRLFSKEFPADSGRMVLNESAVKALGFSSPAAAVGKKVHNNFQENTYTNEIVGVVKDFHFEDLHLPISPYAFRLARGTNNYLIVHARAGEPGPLLTAMGAIWHRLNPNEPFEYSFLDEDFQKNYAADERLSTMIRYFTIMAILISCLGLFGLASFSAEQRIREIGIRKVLGASITGIVLLLSKDFLKLVAVAMVIACPVAWLIMHRWLQDFAYRTPISWVVFVITFLSTLGITLFTISFQAIRAGLANPVQSLKAE
ncbi:MAG TPA: ABC transporter permease [Puia sp.]|jgi:putative ABC transport system permease protein